MSSFDPLTLLQALISHSAQSYMLGWTGFVVGTTRPPLPRFLTEALDTLSGNESARDWLGPIHLDAYLRHKQAEVAHVGGSLPGQTLRLARRKLLNRNGIRCQFRRCFSHGDNCDSGPQ